MTSNELAVLTDNGPLTTGEICALMFQRHEEVIDQVDLFERLRKALRKGTVVTGLHVADPTPDCPRGLLSISWDIA